MTDVAEAPEPVTAPPSRLKTILRVAFTVVAVLVILVVLWNQGQKVIDGEASSTGAYVIVIALVFGDAIFPVLPGETTLNAAVILAQAGQLNFALVVVCGAIGAITGDSALYWIARTAKGRVRRWLDKAEGAKSGQRALSLLDSHGSAFLLFGRYVPGLRFAINVTLGGVIRMPYRKFLFWSSMSGALWALWVCLSAYYISAALDGYPIAALIVSTFAGTVLIGSAVWAQTRWRERRDGETDATPVTGAPVVDDAS